jgi:hypothetical protein
VPLAVAALVILGLLVYTVTERAEEAELVLPTASVLVAVSE